jgi:hypothetical protein
MYMYGRMHTLLGSLNSTSATEAYLQSDEVIWGVEITPAHDVR